MEKHSESTLYTEQFFQKICRWIWVHRYVILGSLIAGFLAYTYLFTNKFPNHDDLRALFTKGTTFASGRWGLRILALVLPNISMPWIYGVLSLLFLTAGNCLIVRLFGIKTPLLQFLLGGILISFPSQTGTFGYMFTACPYAVAFFLSVLSVFLLCKCHKQYLTASVCLILCLSIYQAYLSIAVSLLILFLICRILTEKENAPEVFFTGIRFVVFLTVSLGLYWLATKLMWRLTGTQMGAYADSSLTFSMGTLLEGVGYAYQYFSKILFKSYGGLIPSALSRILHFLCLFLAGIECVLFTLHRKDRRQAALLLFLLLILPLGINCMFLFVSVQSIHTLVLYSFAAIYVLLAVLIEHGQCRDLCFARIHGIGLDCIVLCMAVIMVCNIYVANTAAMRMQLAYENLYAFSTSVVTRLQSTPGYTEDSKVAIIGTYDTPDFYYAHFPTVGYLMGTYGITPTDYSVGDFFSYYIGLNLAWASEQEREAILQTAEFAGMQPYPNYGCLEQIGDVFVIKLSD